MKEDYQQKGVTWDAGPTFCRFDEPKSAQIVLLIVDTETSHENFGLCNNLKPNLLSYENQVLATLP